MEALTAVFITAGNRHVAWNSLWGRRPGGLLPLLTPFSFPPLQIRAQSPSPHCLGCSLMWRAPNALLQGWGPPSRRHTHPSLREHREETQAHYNSQSCHSWGLVTAPSRG